MSNFVRSKDFAAWSATVANAQALQTGDVVAQITSGADTGLVGPFDLTATDGRQTLANIKGVAMFRVSAVDSTGIQERFLPNQDGRLVTIYTRAGAADGNYGFIVNSSGARVALNAETNQLTKVNLAAKGYYFIN